MYVFVLNNDYYQSVKIGDRKRNLSDADFHALDRFFVLITINNSYHVKALKNSSALSFRVLIGL